MLTQLLQDEAEAFLQESRNKLQKHHDKKHEKKLARFERQQTANPDEDLREPKCKIIPEPMCAPPGLDHVDGDSLAPNAQQAGERRTNEPSWEPVPINEVLRRYTNVQHNLRDRRESDLQKAREYYRACHDRDSHAKSAFIFLKKGETLQKEYHTNKETLQLREADAASRVGGPSPDDIQNLQGLHSRGKDIIDDIIYYKKLFAAFVGDAHKSSKRKVSRLSSFSASFERLYDPVSFYCNGRFVESLCLPSRERNAH